MTYKITDKCRFCYTCISVCPAEAIKESYPIFEIDQDLCEDCGLCYEVCRHGAIKKIDEKQTGTL